jgi:low temperature requirement protein LtrA
MLDADDQYRVTTLELFFDLVFVFAITQLTGVLVHELSAKGLLQVLLVFGVLWWMYGGYAWLTNVMTPHTVSRRLLLMLGMAGFLLLALATPTAFTGGGTIWGFGYLIVVLIHAGLYYQVNPKILRALPTNLAAPAAVIAAGLIRTGPAVYVLWTLALLIPVLSPYFVKVDQHFTLNAAHIVERHGLAVLITLGESVVAIGIGLAEVKLTTSTALAAVLALALVGALWWTYFDGDDERTERSLANAEIHRRTAMVLYGYYYAHIPIVLGVIGMAAGLKKVLGHAWSPLHSLPAAFALAGGVSLYLLGDAWFRHILRLGPSVKRLAAAALALATVPLGAWFGEAEVAGLLVILTATLIAESRGRTTGPVAHTTSATWDN